MRDVFFIEFNMAHLWRNFDHFQFPQFPRHNGKRTRLNYKRANAFQEILFKKGRRANRPSELLLSPFIFVRESNIQGSRQKKEILFFMSGPKYDRISFFYKKLISENMEVITLVQLMFLGF